MLRQIITIYVVCDDLLRSLGHKDDPQTRMTTAEVMTTALVAAWFFGGNLETARHFLYEHGYIPQMLGKSRLNRRLHALPCGYWAAALRQLAHAEGAEVFVVDSCPLPVCRYTRAQRCKLYQDLAYFGYCAAKEEHFYGLKAHTLVTDSGLPVEVLLLPGCSTDLVGLQEMDLNLPQGVAVCGDKAYNFYRYEAKLAAEQGIRLLPLRKKNSRRPHPEEVTAWVSRVRKRIETTFSAVTERLGHHIRAVTPAGFELKVMLAFVAYAILG